MKYRASRGPKDHLTIHDVPIFVTCRRGESNFDEKWLASAVKRAMQAADEGYFPPLHIRHHGDGEQPQPAGFFRVTGLRAITFKGKTRTAIFADLVITRPWVEEDVLSMRLPYRSVEIFNVEKPSIDSLALLDHEPPYLELPMLMVDEVDGEMAVAGVSPSVASATFANPWRASTYLPAEPVVACFRRGLSAQIFLQDTDTMSITKTKSAGKPSKTANTKAAGAGGESTSKDNPKRFASDSSDDDKGESYEKDESEGDGGGEGEDMEGEGKLDVASICKAIKDGSISVAEMEEIKAAIAEQQAAVAPEPEDETEPVAQAMAPGQAMQKDHDLSSKFAALAGENAALKARLDEKDKRETREKDVSAALKRLEGRPLGADLGSKLAAFHSEHGPKAFKAYVDSMAQTFGALAGRIATDDGTAPIAAHDTPEAALAYVDQGAEAVATAASLSREWKMQHDRRFTRASEERYIATNMPRKGFKAAATAKAK